MIDTSIHNNFRSINKYFKFFNMFSCFCFFCMLSTSAIADTAFTLAVDNNQPTPGETIIFSSDLIGTSADTMLTNRAGITIDEVGDLPPYNWQVTIPANASGSMTFQAAAIVDKVRFQSNPVTITVIPDQTKLESIFFWPGRPFWLSSGKNYQLQVRGNYLDSVERVITSGATGTVYSKNIVDGLTVTPGDSPVISISADGLLTAVTPGTAEVVAENNGKLASLRVFVQEVVPAFRISGSAYNFPETATYRATYTLDVTGSTTPSGSVKYYYTKTRLNFVSSYITDVSKNGEAYSISGIGTVNGVAGYSFTTNYTNGTPDSLGIEIRKSDNSVYFTSSLKNVASGDIAVTQ